jgi:hypothetical protein
MKLTNTELKRIIKEELESVISETEGSNEEGFVAAYRAHLMNQGEQDVGMADQAARQALETLKKTGSSIEAAIAFLGQGNQGNFNQTVSPSKPASSRSWHGDDGQDNLPHQSTWEE